MSCTDCFNGCSDIKSDQCIRYTGVDVPLLGIQNGDSLSVVESSLITFLTSVLDGTGITLTIPNDIICNIVNNYLKECEDLTLPNVTTALIKSICDLQVQVDSIVETLNTLNGPYTTDCLEGVTGFSDTHTVLQAVITNLCAFNTQVTEVENSLGLYVLISEFNTMVANYLSSVMNASQMKNRMVPWVAMEYYNTDISGFDSTGKGFPNTVWDSIYLCNGNNGTPDKRGRIAVGAIANMGTNSMDASVDPAYPGNYNYTLGQKVGVNTIVLDPTQMPIHTHIATSTVTDPKHHHSLFGNDGSGGTGALVTTTNYANVSHGWNDSTSYEIEGTVIGPTLGGSSDESTNITVATINANTGGGLSHPNVQPVIAAYYIMFIP